jgi:DNA-binding NarL/FixJ family response regulator
MTDRNAATLLIGEELPLIREALAELCKVRIGARIVAQAGDGKAAWEAIERTKPDFALLDLFLQELSVFEILQRIRASQLSTRVLVMSTRRDRKTILEALRCGASGYILKSGSPDQLAEAVAEIAKGGVYVSPVLDIGKQFTSIQARPPHDPIDALSAREFQVFHMLVDGLRAKEIAARLEVSPKTVDTYRAGLMRKLDIHDVAGLVKFAIQRDITSA